MKIALQFAMPSELHALPGARELAPLETVSGVPIFEIAPSGKLPTTRVRRRISRFSRSMTLLVRMRVQCSPGKSQ